MILQLDEQELDIEQDSEPEPVNDDGDQVQSDGQSEPDYGNGDVEEDVSLDVRVIFYDYLPLCTIDSSPFAHKLLFSCSHILNTFIFLRSYSLCI